MSLSPSPRQFAWWEAFPVLRQRYADGIASQRPAAYWLWANLAAFTICTGPVIIGAVWAALARFDVEAVRASRLPLRRRSDAPAPVLVAAAVAMVALADLSLMSKAEVERIWLPFVPWLAISAAMPPAWRRPALASQAVLALAVQLLVDALVTPPRISRATARWRTARSPRGVCPTR